jgi:hypothetical protein
MMDLLAIKITMKSILFHSITWLFQFGLWLTLFFIIFLVIYLGSADMNQFRYVGF